MAADTMEAPPRDPRKDVVTDEQWRLFLDSGPVLCCRVVGYLLNCAKMRIQGRTAFAELCRAVEFQGGYVRLLATLDNTLVHWRIARLTGLYDLQLVSAPPAELASVLREMLPKPPWPPAQIRRRPRNLLSDQRALVTAYLLGRPGHTMTGSSRSSIAVGLVCDAFKETRFADDYDAAVAVLDYGLQCGWLNITGTLETWYALQLVLDLDDSEIAA